MYRFYVSKEQITDDKVYIDGTDVNHIKNVLRLEKGDWIIACDKEGTDYVSRISDISSERVVLNIEKVQDSDTELPCKIVLFQGLPKKDKMEFIIQKAVELGVALGLCVSSEDGSLPGITVAVGLGVAVYSASSGTFAFTESLYEELLPYLSYAYM